MEASSCHMVMNQDGSVQLHIAETEIGQGADTVFAQMVADTVGADEQGSRRLHAGHGHHPFCTGAPPPVRRMSPDLRSITSAHSSRIRCSAMLLISRVSRWIRSI
ncbi:MAG: molybdopterin cofactor-binding domain-containing protein [Eubacteriales bacterium]